MISTAEATTVQYRLSLSHALHAASPALAALHTSRVAALHPELSFIVQPTHCPKCGTHRFSGDHPSCLVGPSTRKKRRAKSHAKDLYRRCHSCGFALTSPSPDQPSAPTQPPNGSSRTRTTLVVPRIKGIRQEPPPSDVTVQATKVPPLLGRASQSKSSHTKMSTLKHMLCRDRQREEEAKSKKKRKEGHEGLADFLKEL